MYSVRSEFASVSPYSSCVDKQHLKIMLYEPYYSGNSYAAIMPCLHLSPLWIGCRHSLAFVDAKDWVSYAKEQPLITTDLTKMEERMDYYGVYDVSWAELSLVDLLSNNTRYLIAAYTKSCGGGSCRLSVPFDTKLSWCLLPGKYDRSLPTDGAAELRYHHPREGAGST